MMKSARNRKIFWISLIPVLIGLYCAKKLTAPDEMPVALEISSPSDAVFSGGTMQLSAIVTLRDGSTDDVSTEATWSTSPGEVGYIDETGKFIALMNSIGIETVEVVYQGQSAQKEIYVRKGASTLTIMPVVSYILEREKLQFHAFARFQDQSTEEVTPFVRWEVITDDEESIVGGSIDENGLFMSAFGDLGITKIVGTYQILSDTCDVNIVSSLAHQFPMMLIPGGKYNMGDDTSAYVNEKPAHAVVLDAFRIGKYEITNGQYAQYLTEAYANGDIILENDIVTGRTGPYAWREYIRLSGASYFPYRFFSFGYNREAKQWQFWSVLWPDRPVIRLTWYGAAAFCMHYGFRLPTEAEWEMASRGGDHLEFGTEDGSISHDLANYKGTQGADTYDLMAPVGSFPPNPFGVYDLCGNAAEYVYDQYDGEYYAKSPYENPPGPGPKNAYNIDPNDSAVWRGGAWFLEEDLCRSAFRGYAPYQPNTSVELYFIGFRVARSLK